LHLASAQAPSHPPGLSCDFASTGAGQSGCVTSAVSSAGTSSMSARRRWPCGLGCPRRISEASRCSSRMRPGRLPPRLACGVCGRNAWPPPGLGRARMRGWYGSARWTPETLLRERTATGLSPTRGASLVAARPITPSRILGSVCSPDRAANAGAHEGRTVLGVARQRHTPRVCVEPDRDSGVQPWIFGHPDSYGMLTRAHQGGGGGHAPRVQRVWKANTLGRSRQRAQGRRVWRGSAAHRLAARHPGARTCTRWGACPAGQRWGGAAENRWTPAHPHRRTGTAGRTLSGTSL